jgi:DNA-binding PucR family transcriptional regulator
MILTYLECDCNATHAADKLFLHRNTIRKAVQFVEDTWQISLSDTEIKKKIVLSELVEKYIELMK